MEQNLLKKTRTENDLIGSREVPEEALYGVQTLRGIENFLNQQISFKRISLVHPRVGRNKDGSRHRQP